MECRKWQSLQDNDAKFQTNRGGTHKQRHRLRNQPDLPLPCCDFAWYWSRQKRAGGRQKSRMTGTSDILVQELRHQPSRWRQESPALLPLAIVETSWEPYLDHRISSQGERVDNGAWRCCHDGIEVNKKNCEKFA
jgi:hypothetical protein